MLRKLDALLAETQLHLLEAAASGKGKQYRARLRSAVRALWTGIWDVDQFFDELLTIISVGLTDAWEEGAKQCGIEPEDLDKKELAALRTAIGRERNFIFGFGDAVSDSSKANKGKLRPLMSRVDTWANRYTDVANQARIMACANKKLKWKVDPSKENCKSCLRLNGQVRRGKIWAKHGVRPQNPPNGKLECKGWKCGCSLDPTDDPVTRGRFPKLP